MNRQNTSELESFDETTSFDDQLSYSEESPQYSSEPVSNNYSEFQDLSTPQQSFSPSEPISIPEQPQSLSTPQQQSISTPQQQSFSTPQQQSFSIPQQQQSISTPQQQSISTPQSFSTPQQQETESISIPEQQETESISIPDFSTSLSQPVSTAPSSISLYDQSQEPTQEYQQEPTQEYQEEPIQEEPTQEYQQEPIQEEPTQEYQQQEELVPGIVPIETPQYISDEDLQQLEEKEKSIRSKILNQPPPCQKKQTNQKTPYIEKVQLNTPLIKTEESISKLLKIHSSKLHTFLYFQPLIEVNPLSVGTITECETPDPSIDGTRELIETKYKRTTTQSLTQFLKSQLAQPKQSNKFIQLLTHSHLQLLDSIAILQSIEPAIVHFHITPQTVLYNEIDATPVLTDFRLSFTEQTLQNEQESSELFPSYDDYPGWPFEVYLLSQDKDNDQPQEQLAAAFSEMTQLPPPETPITELKTHYKTWDVYAVNQLIYSFMIENEIPIDEIPFMMSYKDLIRSYLIAKPSERPIITTFQENIRNIFRSIPKEDYISFLNRL